MDGEACVCVAPWEAGGPCGGACGPCGEAGGHCAPGLQEGQFPLKRVPPGGAKLMIATLYRCPLRGPQIGRASCRERV